MSDRKRQSRRKAHKQRLWIEQSGLCAYCQRPMTRRPKCVARQAPTLATCDHMIPKARKGTDSLSNIVLACSACNLLKGDRMPVEFFFNVRKGA